MPADVRLLVRSPARIPPAMAPHGLAEVDNVVGRHHGRRLGRASAGGLRRRPAHGEHRHARPPARRGDPRRQPAGHRQRAACRARAGHGPDHPRLEQRRAHAEPGPAADNRVAAREPPGAYSQSKVGPSGSPASSRTRARPWSSSTRWGCSGPTIPIWATSPPWRATCSRAAAVRGRRRDPDGRRARRRRPSARRSFKPGRGASRYMVSGGYVTIQDFAIEASQVTGRRIPAIKLPGRPMLGVGQAADWVHAGWGEAAGELRGPVVHGLQREGRRVGDRARLGVRFRAPADARRHLPVARARGPRQSQAGRDARG